MSKSKAINPVLEPQLSDIVNCQLTKKDVMELLEAELIQEIDEIEESLTIEKTKLTENDDTLIKEFRITVNKIQERVHSIIKNTITKQLKSLNIKPKEEGTKITIYFNVK